MSALFPRRAALAVAIAGLAASFANPASASGCRVDANADVTTAVGTVHVRYWYDEGQEESGVNGEDDVVITVGDTDSFRYESTHYNPEGRGIVAETTGVDVREVVCGALEG